MPTRRPEAGTSLLEMVIAIALSGFFVALLSGLLSQTLAFSDVSQEELLAGAAAEVLVDQLRNQEYAAFVPGTSTLAMNFVSGSEPTEVPRSQVPVQLNFVDPTYAYSTTSNYLKNTTVTETVTDGAPITGLTSWQVDIAIRYPVAGGGTKTLSRQLFVFDGGK